MDIRLSSESRNAINEVMAQVLKPFSPWKVWLFGSRVNPNAKGGDIDLLVEIGQPIDDPLKLLRVIKINLIKKLGDQKIDIVLSAPGGNPTALIENAKNEGVLLCQSPS